jgi:HD-GYP domain-containing protein (c-di-GMP phosphodiesterase class II)
VTIQNENDYEDLLSLWSDLESGLGIVLGNPDSIQEFEQRIWQYDRWMEDLLQRDTDLGLYLLFQLATYSPVGYSASHALISSVLCQLIALELELPRMERNSLVHAAMTMNISMTALQDQLAEQALTPSTVQQGAIAAHPVNSSATLANIGVTDELWLDTISLHHDETTEKGELRVISPVHRLARILRVVDRYAALISPRKSREGRSTIDSMRSIIARATQQPDEVGLALARIVGLYPPGTYVRLDSGELAVVVRRSDRSNLPDVAIVISERGTLFNPPRLHRTANGSPRIKAPLPLSSMRQHLNHHLILRLTQD